MQMPDEVSNGQVVEGSGWLIKFGRSRCRWPMKFRMVPVQIADKVAELSGAHSRQSDEVSNGQVLEGSGWLIKFGGSRCRWPMKFRMVPVQVHIADKVPEGSDADA